MSAIVPNTHNAIDHEAEKEKLLEDLLVSKKECQVRFGGSKTEIKPTFTPTKDSTSCLSDCQPQVDSNDNTAINTTLLE
jgi:hypothetical protein